MDGRRRKVRRWEWEWAVWCMCVCVCVCVQWERGMAEKETAELCVFPNRDQTT